MLRSTSAGAWDVFAWRDGTPLFFELKHAGTSDRIREQQLAWRDAALRLGVPESAFSLVEWIEGSREHHALRR